MADGASWPPLIDVTVTKCWKYRYIRRIRGGLDRREVLHGERLPSRATIARKSYVD